MGILLLLKEAHFNTINECYLYKNLQLKAFCLFMKRVPVHSAYPIVPHSRPFPSICIFCAYHRQYLY